MEEQKPKREYPNQHPNYPDKSHFEEFLNDEARNYVNVPRCQCWKTDHSAQCNTAAMEGQKICVDHGGRGVAANKRIQTRKQFQQALAEHQEEDGTQNFNAEMIKELAKLCKNGNLEAIKYWFNQQFGGPATIVVINADPHVMKAIGMILGDYIEPEKLDECFKRLEQAIIEAASA